MFIRIVKYTAGALALLLIVIYSGDYVVLRYRIKSGHGFDTRSIQPTYAIPHKDGRQEFVFGDAVTVPCVHSLFPHYGDKPCWYVDRTSSKAIQM